MTSERHSKLGFYHIQSLSMEYGLRIHVRQQISI
jgi:hypothetical protein